MSGSSQTQLANQVFVRNLPYDVSDEDLTALFEEVGPLKNVSIAKEANGKSRGFGFVKFALEDDAKAALTKLQGHDIKGRKLKLELGIKKDNDSKKRKRDDGEAAEQTPAAPAAPAAAAAAAAKPAKAPATTAPTKATEDAKAKPAKAPKKDAAPAAAVETAKTADAKTADATDAAEAVSRGRQVLVFGVPLDVNKKIFSRVLDKVVRKVRVEFVTEGHPVSESALITYPAGKVVLLTTNSRPDAQKIVEALNKETIGNLGFGKFNFSEDAAKGKKEAAEAAEEAAGDADEAVAEMFRTKNMLKQRLIARLHSEIAPLAHRKKRCRLIIRNLSFQARDLHIMDRMKRFGPIVDIDLPITVLEKPLKKRGPKGGDAAAETSGESAAPATKQVETHRGFAFITFLCEADAKNAVAQSNVAGQVLKICNREVAVDHCYSKDTYLKYGSNPPPEEAADADAAAAATGDAADDDDAADGDEAVQSDEDNDEDEDASAADEDDAETDEDEDDGSLEEDHGSDLDLSDDEDGDEAAPKDKDEYVSTTKNQKLIGGDVNEGRTLFLRNLAYDMTAEDIKAVLQRYGRVELALVVKDKATGTSKGSAFVKFADALSADRCLKECEVSGVEIKHKNVKVARAIDRDSAEKIKQGQKPGKDKRNLYLANEGLALDGDATAHMNEHDREKRTRAQADKKKKLQNPLFFVSHERLSIRNLAKHVKDHDLKILCLKATKAGLNKDLVTLQDMQNLQQAQGPELFDAPSSSSSSSAAASSSSSTVKLRSINQYSLQDLRSLPTFDSKTCIRSAKVILDLDRAAKDAANKAAAAPSRGYGFVEFSHHAFALACLRELNHNAAYEQMAQQVAGKDKEARTRLIAEFSLENIRKVKILKDRQDRVETRREQQRALSNATAEEKLARKKEKRRLQREQKRQRKATQDEEAAGDAPAGDAAPAAAPASKKRKHDDVAASAAPGGGSEAAASKKAKKVTIRDAAAAPAAAKVATATATASAAPKKSSLKKTK